MAERYEIAYLNRMMMKVKFSLLLFFIMVAASAIGQDLRATILHLDSVFFNAYNTCDMETQSRMISDSIEFYHDHNGLSTSKQELLTGIKNNICGKVSRVLEKGSVEVYPIPGFGAVEIGYHRFINHQEKDHLSGPGRFVIFWRQRDGQWQLTRIASIQAGS
jgi:hypothetical protein